MALEECYNSTGLREPDIILHSPHVAPESTEGEMIYPKSHSQRRSKPFLIPDRQSFYLEIQWLSGQSWKTAARNDRADKSKSEGLSAAVLGWLWYSLCFLEPHGTMFTVHPAILLPMKFLNLFLLRLSHFSRVQLCVTPQTAAHQAPPSLGFSRQEHWSGLPWPSPMHESEKWKWSHSVVSDSLQPHGLQPTRLLCPWDFPGKSTGVGCCCLLHL